MQASLYMLYIMYSDHSLGLFPLTFSKYYVLLAVLVCALITGLLLYFLFPRDVILKSDDVTIIPTSIYINTTTHFMSMTIMVGPR